MARGAQGTSQEREGAHAHARSCCRRAARAALGEGRDGVRVRYAGGQANACRLFDERSQLIIYHFMMGPDWEQGCVGCSFLCDHVDGANQHLMQHDVTFVAVSRAPLAKIESYKKRMGWRFPWVSSYGSDFNFDYHVSFTPEEVTKGKAYYNYEIQDVGIDELSGRSVFFKDAGATFFTLTHPMRAEETHFSAHTTISTSRPKAATRPVPATI